MPSSTNRQGLQNNPFLRPKAGPNIQGPVQNLTPQQLQDFLRQPFRDPVRDLMKQPFRPSQDRTVKGGLVPRIPLKDYQTLQTAARKLALRIIKQGTRLHPFRIIFDAIMDWLINWLGNKLVKRGSGGWMKMWTCPDPLPPIGGLSYSGSVGYHAVPRPCTTGQNVQSAATLSALHPNDVSALEHQVYAIVGTTQRTQIIGVYQRPTAAQRIPIYDLPSLWDLARPPTLELEFPPPVRKHLVPGWKDIVNDVPSDRTPNDEPNWPEDRPSREESKELRYNTKTKTVVQREYERLRRPTRTREKEQKFAGASAAVKQIFGWLARNKERLTELDDFLDTMIDALPKDIKKSMPKRNGRSTPDLKAKHIYNNWDKIDWNKWVDNFVKNWIEDKAIGTAIALSDKAALKRGASNTLASRGSWLHNAVGGMKT